MPYLNDLKEHFKKDNYWSLNYHTFINSYEIPNLKDFHKDLDKLGLTVAFREAELVIQIKESKNENLL